MNTQILKFADQDSMEDRDNVRNQRYMHFLFGMIFTVTVLVLVTITGIWLMDSQTLPIRQVSISGKFEHLSSVSLKHRAAEVVSGGFLNVNVEEIRTVLLEEPWVHEVSVKRVWPDKLTVNIQEQIAVARWGDQGLLNIEAEIFNPEPDTYPVGLPLIKGPFDSHKMILEEYQQLVQVLPEGLTITELNLNDRWSREIKLDNGSLIRLGKRDMERRLERFIRYFPVVAQSIVGRIQYIDLRYTNGFAISWKTDSEKDPEIW